MANTHILYCHAGANAVEVFDTAINSFVATIRVSATTSIFKIAINPDGKHAYLPTDNHISVIDTVNNKVVPPGIPVGSTPHDIAVMPDGKHTYVTSDNGISVIDLTTRRVGSFPVGGIPNQIALAPDGQHGYVTNSSLKIVSVIDTHANKVMATISVPTTTGAVAFRPDGKRVYVGELVNPGAVLVIDTATNTVMPTVALNQYSVSAIGIVPPPPGIPFVAMGASVVIEFGGAPGQDAFSVSLQLHSERHG